MSIKYENIHNLYAYNRETGDVISRATGESVCKIRTNGKWGKMSKHIIFDGKAYSVSKIAYLLVNKHPFNGRVLFRDGDPLNTRWDNMNYMGTSASGPKLNNIDPEGTSLASRVVRQLHGHTDPEAEARAIATDKNKPLWLRELAVWLLEP
jgi:hypothetical protein